ncbi:SAV_2336 N-terminal domain-related protein [Streptomyces sp. NPDC006458]|uniref:SAV_2336 N-terminal domain-related protein n=1 Tax=Streptomyces TaxID=1883 RepID=UPI0029AE797C|nr:SAV_2336 N-terminal domain-related protein [Streptomyces scabiei]MDX3204707.1 SAV_2336 N-terminal domain-related protein [Streptomyces scabiei]
MTIRTNTASALNRAPAYRLQLVFDAGPTMSMWRPLLRELRQSLARSGPFQSVTVAVLKADGTLRGRQGEDDRLVTLVLSDCSGPQWHPGPAGERWYKTLRSWARVRPVAVVQPLPERMWQRTALPGTPGSIYAPAAGAANSELRFTAYDSAPDTGADSIPVPVLEPASPWLENWFALLGSGGTKVPAAVAFIPPALPAEGTASLAGLTAEELVLRFRATASPEAFRLAGYLAAGVPHLPVMQLVHRSIGTAPCPSHLAEVILSGLLRAVPGRPGTYAFREDVASVLLRTVPRSSLARTVALLRQAEPSMRRALVSAEASRLVG